MAEIKIDDVTYRSILDSEKVIQADLVYRTKLNGDFREAQAPVLCAAHPEVNIRFISLYHIARVPRKFCFLLTLEGERILALDVEPGHTHTNPLSLKTVHGTHWHAWPDVEEAREDGQSCSHWEWFMMFLRRANLSYEGTYEKPKFDTHKDQIPLIPSDGQGDD
jgi:hypothetical protein